MIGKRNEGGKKEKREKRGGKGEKREKKSEEDL